MGTSSRYQLLVFDFDGTLVDTALDIAAYANEVLVEYGFPSKDLPAVKKAIGRGVRELFRELGFHADEARLEEAVAAFKRRYFEKPVVLTRAYPGVREALGGPLARVKKAICTNKPQAVTERILLDLGLAAHFESVIGDGGGFPRKPDPASLLHQIRLLGASPQTTLFVGDSVIDHQTAANAGTGFLWVDWGYDSTLSRHEDLPKASHALEWSHLAA
jgi:phosphoglycolate phosphatase